MSAFVPSRRLSLQLSSRSISTTTAMSQQQHPALSRLLSANSQWAADVEKSLPGFFKELAKYQSPKVLWIGCADSRVPESVITACKPGDIFVHRNIANQFHLDDDSALSVLTFAIEQVKVEHIIVVGHTQCGGAIACFNAAKNPSPSSNDTPLGRWLTPLTQLASNLQSEFPDGGVSLLIEENVKSAGAEGVPSRARRKCLAGREQEAVVGAWMGLRN